MVQDSPYHGTARVPSQTGIKMQEIDVFTPKRPSICPASENAHKAFILDAVRLRGNVGAIARLKIAAREQDKWRISKAINSIH